MQTYLSVQETSFMLNFTKDRTLFLERKIELTNYLILIYYICKFASYLQIHFHTVIARVSILVFF